MFFVFSSTEVKIPHNGEKLKFDTFIYKKKFKYRTNNTKEIGKGEKWPKIS